MRLCTTSKSTTILNYCKIGTNYIDYICDTTKEKIGKYSPGMHIRIKDINYFHNMRDCVYLFAWNHKDEILSKEKILKENGSHMSTYKKEYLLVVLEDLQNI